MTRDEYIDSYCAYAEITRSEFNAKLIAIPCSCGANYCNGWVAVGKGQPVGYNGTGTGDSWWVEVE